jgi:hypothetical protein
MYVSFQVAIRSTLPFILTVYVPPVCAVMDSGRRGEAANHVLNQVRS